MSDDAAPKKAKGKGKGKMIIILAAVALLGGGGTAGGLYAAGFFSKEDTGPKIDPNKPVLVLKGENPEDIAAAHAAPEGAHESEDSVESSAAHAAPGKGHGPAADKGIDLPTPADPSKYQATYFQIQAPFTSNMADSDAFAQIAVAVSTYYDGRVIQAMTTHEMAIRSAVLMELAQQDQTALETPQGKEDLQKKLKSIINGVLKQKTGYGGIDNVYFTNFVIQ